MQLKLLQFKSFMTSSKSFSTCAKGWNDTNTRKKKMMYLAMSDGKYFQVFICSEKFLTVGFLVRFISVRKFCNVTRPNLGIHGTERSRGFWNGDLKRAFGVIGSF